MEGNTTGRLNPKLVRFELTGYQNGSELYKHIDCNKKQLICLRKENLVGLTIIIIEFPLSRLLEITEIQSNLGTVNT